MKPKTPPISPSRWPVVHKSQAFDPGRTESRGNDGWARHNDAVIGRYHFSKCSGDAVIDIMRTQPMMIIGGILQRDPFFRPPPEFLPEYRRRCA
jgi:hypothetical protein